MGRVPTPSELGAQRRAGSAAASRSETASIPVSPRSSHSHTAATLQPSRFSAATARWSRARFPASFAAQNSRLRFGIAAWGHPTWACQKHP